MPLAPSTRVGPYEIVSLVGEGGMGEVYKARDTRLDRTVAIKFSQARFSERFEREARAIAALNHPNICQLYDVGPDYLVMEYVDGARIGPVDSNRRLLDIAVQIADGLAAAHAAGFVHRDLKPDNVLLTHDGRVKILDFGVAKHLIQAGNDEATHFITTTVPGRVVGTAAYMSPEQARGEEVDARTDQFAFGLLLYEMITGRRPFQRATAAETIAAIIRDEPPPLPVELPLPLRWITERCLAKDPAERYASTRDLYQELRTIREHISQVSLAAAPPARSQFTRRAWLMGTGSAAALTAGAAAGALWERSRLLRAPLWSGLTLGGPAFALGPRMSPDGQLLAFIAMVGNQTQPAIMRPDASSWTVLTNQTDSGPALNLAWSPDGTRLYFDRYWDKPRGVYMIPPLGGEPVLVLENAAAPLPLPDGSLVVLKASRGLRDQMYRFWPSSGRLEPLPAYVPFWRLTGAMRASRDGANIVFFRSYAEGDSTTSRAPALCSLELATGRVRRLGPDLRLRYFESEVLAVAITPDNKSVLFGVHEEDTYRVIAAPLDGGSRHRVLMSLPASSSLWHLDVAPDESLYLDQVVRPMSLLRFSDSGGAAEHTVAPEIASQSILALADGRLLFTGLQAGRRHLMIAQPGTEPRRFLPVAEENSLPFARAGRDALAFVAGTPPHTWIGIASFPEGRILRQLPYKAPEVRSISASPDGRVLYYAADNAIWSAPADGSATPRRLSDGDHVAADPTGRYLYIKQLGTDPIRLLRLPLAGGAAQEIAIPDDLRLTIQNFSPGAFDAQGRMLIEVISRHSWFYGVAILDPADDSLRAVPVQFPGGIISPNWVGPDRVLSLGVGLASSLWRYRQVY